jgi:hypothetical protein
MNNHAFVMLVTVADVADKVAAAAVVVVVVVVDAAWMNIPGH